MKRSEMYLLTMLLMIFAGVKAQNVSTRTNEFQVDLSDPKKLVSSVIPVINWIIPAAESSYASETKFPIKFEIESTAPLKSITVSIKENVESGSRGMLTIEPKTEAEKHINVVEKNLTLMDGNNVIEIVAENADGVKTVSQRSVRVGTTAMADASKLDRSDYAI